LEEDVFFNSNETEEVCIVSKDRPKGSNFKSNPNNWKMYFSFEFIFKIKFWKLLLNWELILSC